MSGEDRMNHVVMMAAAQVLLFLPSSSSYSSLSSSSHSSLSFAPTLSGFLLLSPPSPHLLLQGLDASASGLLAGTWWEHYLFLSQLLIKVAETPVV